jgi:hypothetical protein
MRKSHPRALQYKRENYQNQRGSGLMDDNHRLLFSRTLFASPCSALVRQGITKTDYSTESVAKISGAGLARSSPRPAVGKASVSP